VMTRYFKGNIMHIVDWVPNTLSMWHLYEHPYNNIPGSVVGFGLPMLWHMLTANDINLTDF
jgi:hypothetical protein